MANAEMDMKANLTDLTKIPAKEFEKHFRDWMERDDVARALQAKLRTDLISNFNKTALGRQILAQTSTTKAGGSTQRLTLSPLVLALNTLVAEFLYAQNCHFSLSVFCTEVPYRNTLPDFENSQHFRFTPEEIKDILEAIFDKSSFEPAFKSSVIKKYECNKNDSLLLLLLRQLLKQKDECMKKMASIKSGVVTEGTQTVHLNGDTEGLIPPQNSQETRPLKTELPSGNIRYLNKYLMILSNKVKEMSEEFEEMRNKRCNMPSTKISKSVRTRRYEKLNRSLERITDQLKHMTHTKRKSKQIGAVVSAIDTLATQFSKCVDSFRSVSRELISSNQKQEHIPPKPTNAQASVQVDFSYRRATAGEQKKTPEEKTYIDWVHEMRHTKNGQKFLDRIETSLKKALNKQRELLRNESEEKLRHQKELLKIQYKEKLVEHITRLPAYDFSREANKLNESIGHQLEEFETRHSELLQKIQDVHKIGVNGSPIANTETEVGSDNNAHTEMTEAIVRRVVREMEPKISPKDAHYSERTKEIPIVDTRNRDPMLKDVVNTQKQLQKMVQSIAKQERNVDQIVYEARMRIQELENESNQLELNFRNYLERQRIQADTMREVVSSLSENHKNGQPKVHIHHQNTLKNIQKFSALKVKNEHREKKPKILNKAIKPIDIVVDLTNQENKSPNFEYRNAILDAKAKLFKVDRTSQHTIATKPESDNEELSLSGIEPFYYNRNFGRFASHINVLSSDISSYQLNERASSLLVHTSLLTPTSMSTMPLTSRDIDNDIDSNALSGRSNGAPLEISYTILPNTRQVISPKSTTKRKERMSRNKHKLAVNKNTETQIKLISQPLPPFSDATTPTGIGQTTMASVVADAADNGERNDSDAEQMPDVLLKHADSETSTSTNDDDIQDNQSISECNKNSSSSSIGSDNHVEVKEAVTEQSSYNAKTKLGSAKENAKANRTACDEDVYTAKTTIKINPQVNSMTLMETMERMHRLFTETPTSVTRGKWTQAHVKTQQKQKPKPNQKTQQNRTQKTHLMPTAKTNRQHNDAAYNNEFLNGEKPTTSAKCLANVKTGKNSKHRREEMHRTSETNKNTEQSLNTFPNTKFAANSNTEEKTLPQYNITIANSATEIEKLPTTISSTTFSVRLDDNLKEVVSESSLEIASMVEAVDEEIELEELVADAEDEEEEEEVEEEDEPMGGVKEAIVQMPVIEEMSVASSTTSSVLRMSVCGGGGGGADVTRQSDSGSDFWE